MSIALCAEAPPFFLHDLSDRKSIASNCFFSVLTPMGTPLLGYRVIGWEMPRGLRQLKVQETLYRPEANNEDLA